MLSTPTQDKLRSLNLYGMLKGFEEQQKSASDYVDLSFEERLGLLVDREMTEQENQRLVNRLKYANLRQSACMEDIDFSHNRGLDRAVVKSLGTGQWIGAHLNVMITGPLFIGLQSLICPCHPIIPRLRISQGRWPIYAAYENNKQGGTFDHR
jgi:DNA replication protein DnaC